MKTIFVMAALVALSVVSTIAPTAAAQFTVNGVHFAGGLSGGGGLTGSLGGTILKQTSLSQSGFVSESDLIVKMDENGLKSMDYVGHSGGYAVNEGLIKTKGPGSYSLSGAGVIGVLDLDLTVTATP